MSHIGSKCLLGRDLPPECCLEGGPDMASSDPEEQTEVLFPTAFRSASQSDRGDMELSSLLSALEKDGKVQDLGFQYV